MLQQETNREALQANRGENTSAPLTSFVETSGVNMSLHNRLTASARHPISDKGSVLKRTLFGASRCLVLTNPDSCHQTVTTLGALARRTKLKPLNVEPSDISHTHRQVLWFPFLPKRCFVALHAIGGNIARTNRLTFAPDCGNFLSFESRRGWLNAGGHFAVLLCDFFNSFRVWLHQCIESRCFDAFGSRDLRLCKKLDFEFKRRVVRSEVDVRS